MPCQVASGLLYPVDAPDTTAWDNAGSPVEASMYIAGQNRPRLAPAVLSSPCRDPSCNATFPWAGPRAGRLPMPYPSVASGGRGPTVLSPSANVNPLANIE